MGRRPKLASIVMPPEQVQPPSTPCPECGYPLYDGVEKCPATYCGYVVGDNEPVQPRDSDGRFSNNVRVVGEPIPRGAMNQLQSAVENLQQSAVAYRNTGDWVMRDSMLADIDQIIKAVHGLIYEREGLR